MFIKNSAKSPLEKEHCRTILVEQFVTHKSYENCS